MTNLFVHKRTGGKYQLIGNAKVQVDGTLADMANVVVYKGENGKLWVRSTDEFSERFRPAEEPKKPTCSELLEQALLAMEFESWAESNGARGPEAIERTGHAIEAIKQHLGKE